MDGWALLIVVLAFIGGFIFSRVVDFFSASSLSINLVKSAHLAALYMFVKSFEKITYYNNLALNDYIKKGESERNISVFKANLEQEVSLFKRRSISVLLENNPKIFRNVVPYDDWPTAMVYLNIHRDFVLKLFKEEQIDD